MRFVDVVKTTLIFKQIKLQTCLAIANLLPDTWLEGQNGDAIKCCSIMSTFRNEFFYHVTILCDDEVSIQG